jgi:branched-chain amino acid transport system substrate-binding protein
MRGKWTHAAIIGCLVLFLAGVLAAGPATAAQPVVKEWKIPSLIFLTGPFAGFGKQVKWATDEAVAEINAAGGVAGRPIVLEWHDTGIDPAKAAAEMSNVVRGSLVIFGPVGSPPTKGAMPIVAREKAFAMPVSSGAEVASEFFPYAVDFLPPATAHTPYTVPGWLKANPRIKTVVQFLFPMDPTFLIDCDLEKKTLESAGVKVLPRVELSETGVDMSSVVVKAMTGKPDGFLFITLPMDSAKIILELEKRGVKDKSGILLSPLEDDPSLYEVGKGHLDGAYLRHFLNMESKAPKWQALYAKYRKAFPEFKAPTLGVPYNYDMVYMFKAAVEKTGITGDPEKLTEERETLRQYCRNVKGFPGVQETFDMVDGLATSKAFLFTIQNNEKKLLQTYVPK